MNNKKWKQFDAFVEKCEENLFGKNKNNSCWQEAYSILTDIVKEGRRKNPDFPKKLYELDDRTDFEHDVQSFLDDYFDMMEDYEKYEVILRSVEEMLTLFDWDESDIADIYFHKASALNLLNRNKEAVEFCKAWLNDYPGNISAVTALIYAMINQYKHGDGTSLDSARELIEQYIQPDTECTDDNDILFTAASLLYEAIDDKETQKQIDDRINAYEAQLDEIMTQYDDDDDEFFF